MTNLYPNVLSRHIINPEMILYQYNDARTESVEFNYERFCGMVDYWKVMLVEKYGAEPGQSCLVEFNALNVYYYSALFAALELGLILIIDWPHAHDEEGTKDYRMKMHGQIDYAIIYSGQATPGDPTYDRWDLVRTQENCRHVITEQDFDNYTIQDPTLYDKVAKTIYATPDSVAIWSSSSGTTGLPKRNIITHKKVFRQAERLIPISDYQGNDRSLHIRNLHHGASMCYHFLPTWMTSREHYLYSFGHFDTEQAHRIAGIIKQHKINKVLLHTNRMTDDVLEFIDPVDWPLDIITLFAVTPKSVPLIKEKNVRSVKVCFGDTTIGLGLFIRSLDQTTDPATYDKSEMTSKQDDFYDFKIEDGILWIAIPELDQSWQTSYDSFECRNGVYYFKGRSNQYRFGADWIRLGDLEALTARLFGPDGATIVVDGDEQKIYLSIWEPNPEAEASIHEYFDKEFEDTRITKIARDLDYNKFMVSRKIDRPRLREYFRRVTIENNDTN